MVKEYSDHPKTNHWPMVLFGDMLQIQVAIFLGYVWSCGRIPTFRGGGGAYRFHPLLEYKLCGLQERFPKN
jgi:hypothetical protein